MSSLSTRLASLALSLSLAACATPDRPDDAPPAAPPAPTPPPAATLPSAGDAEASVTPERAGTASGAVRRYYAAIDARDYQTAYGLWGNGGEASGQTFEAFQAGFAETRTVTVGIPGDVREEGAAGSVYATVPVVVTSTLADGREQRFRGTYTMRRVNGVEGATPAQLMWHIESADLVEDR